MLNNTTLQGRIVATPELKQTVSQISVVSFTLAVERDYKKPGEDKQTDFIDVVAWRNVAEFVAKYFGKGDLIIVQGSIQTRNYEDKNGNKRKAVEIVADKAHFCGAKSDRPTEQQQANLDGLKIKAGLNVQKDDAPTEAITDDDLPF